MYYYHDFYSFINMFMRGDHNQKKKEKDKQKNLPSRSLSEISPLFPIFLFLFLFFCFCFYFFVFIFLFFVFIFVIVFVFFNNDVNVIIFSQNDSFSEKPSHPFLCTFVFVCVCLRQGYHLSLFRLFGEEKKKQAEKRCFFRQIKIKP